MQEIFLIKNALFLSANKKTRKMDRMFMAHSSGYSTLSLARYLRDSEIPGCCFTMIKIFSMNR